MQRSDTSAKSHVKNQHVSFQKEEDGGEGLVCYFDEELIAPEVVEVLEVKG